MREFRREWEERIRIENRKTGRKTEIQYYYSIIKRTKQIVEGLFISLNLTLDIDDRTF